MLTTPVVSVIIPTYNRLWCLPIAVASCRNTRHPTEIIIIDDGSTDGTWEWLKTQDDVIKVRQNKQGQTYAINLGTSIANGQYIRFLDSDDQLCPGMIDKQFEVAIETGADLVYSRVDSKLFSSGQITQAPDLPFWDDFLSTQLGVKDYGHFLGMLFHRKLVERVPRRPDYCYREDRMFLLEVGLLYPKLAYVPGCAGYWVSHDQQMCFNYRGMKADAANWQHLNIYKYILQELARRGELTQRRRQAACGRLWFLANWIAETHLREASEVVEWIYRLDPKFQIPVSGWSAPLHKYLGFCNTMRFVCFKRTMVKFFRREKINKLLDLPIIEPRQD